MAFFLVVNSSRCSLSLDGAGKPSFFVTFLRQAGVVRLAVSNKLASACQVGRSAAVVPGNCMSPKQLSMLEAESLSSRLAAAKLANSTSGSS